MASLVDGRDWSAALALGDKLAATSLASQGNTFRILIEGLITDGQIDKALSLMDTFFRANPDKFSCTSVMRSLIRAHRVDEALALFRRMSHIDHVAGSVLAVGFLHAGRLTDAARLVLELDRLQPPPGASLYRQLLSAMLDARDRAGAAAFVAASKRPAAIARCADLLARLGIDDAAKSAVSLLSHTKEKADAHATSHGRRIIGALVQFSRRGKVEEVERMVNEIPDDESATLADARSVLLDTYVNQRQFAKAAQLLRRIKDGVPLSKWLLQAALKAHVALGDVRAAADLLEEAAAHRGVTPDVSACNTVLTGWVRLRRMQEAEALFEAMSLRGVAPTLVSYIILLRGYCEAGDLQQAEGLVQRMRAAGVQPTAVIWSALLTLLGRKDLPAALARLEALVAEGLQPSPELCNTLINRLASKDMPKALAMKDRLLRGPHKPDSVTYNTLVSALLKRNDPATAETLCTEMSTLGLAPDLLMCKDMARAWRTAGDAAKAVAWEAKAEAFGVNVAKQESDPASPAVQLLRKALSAVTSGELSEMRAHVTCLRTANVRAEDYVVLARRLAHRGALDEVRWLLSEAQAAGVGRPVGIWNVLLNEHVRMRREGEAAALLREMQEEGTQPDAETFALQLAMLAHGGKLTEAEALFNSMKELGVPPTTIACNRLMHAYAKCGDIRRAMWLLDHMLELGALPDPYTYLELVRVNVVGGDLNAAIKLVEERADVLPPSAFLFVIRALERAHEPSGPLIRSLRLRMARARKQYGVREASYTQLRHMLDD